MNILEMALDIRDNGIDCHRCGKNQRTPKEVTSVILMVAHSPLMDTPSPPIVLCDECGLRTAAFMGVEGMQEILQERYGG